MEKVKFQVPDNFDDEKESSFLVHFSNGQLLPTAQNKPTYTLYQKTKDRSQKKRIIVAKTDHMSYIGSNYDPEAEASNTKYCVGELDRSSGVIVLHKTELVTLKPHIPGKTDIPEEAVTDVSTPVKPTVSFNQMVTSFGSEKQKRAYSAAIKNKVETEALETALATAVVHAQNELDKAEASVPVNTSEYMPPYNPLAEVPQDVYKLEDVLSLSTIASLKKMSLIFKKATLKQIHEWRSENRFPEYVLDHISLPIGEPQRSLKAAVLLGLSLLMKMHNLKSREFQKTGLVLEGVELLDNVKAELLEKFTEQQESKSGKVTNILPARMKDKIRLHLLVLTLILDDFTVDCLTLQRDLKLSGAKIMDHFRALGCTVSKKAVKRKSQEEDSDTTVTHTCIAVLRIPLTFPKPRGQKKSKQ